MLSFLKYDRIEGLSVDIFYEQETATYEIRSYGAVHNLSGQSKMLSVAAVHEIPKERFIFELNKWRDSYAD